jgi:hypothetical protein
LYLAELQAEAVEFFLAIFVFAVSIAKMRAEGVPVRKKIGERGIQPF